MTRWIASGSAALLVVIGLLAYMFVFNKTDSSDSPANEASVQIAAVTEAPVEKPAAKKKKSKPAPQNQKQASGNASKPSAKEILEKAGQKYESLTSYSASGKSVSIIDMSKVDLTKIGLNDDAAKAAKDSKEFKQAVSKPQRAENEFSVKLSKPDFYRIEWEGQQGPAKSKGAVWSAGDGDFLLMAVGKVKYVKMQNREMALGAATGISGGVANTMPQVFFQGPSSLLNMFKDAKSRADETVEGVDCYVLTGNVGGMKMVLWFDKSNFLLKQKRQVLGGKMAIPELNDKQIDESLKQLGGKPTPEQQAQMKSTMKNMKSMSAQMKGTITETYHSIETNKPFEKEEFNYEVPAGTELSSSLF